MNEFDPPPAASKWAIRVAGIATATRAPLLAEIDTLRAELTEKTAALEAVRADAERADWLVRNGLLVHQLGDSALWMIVTGDLSPAIDGSEHETARAAIDHGRSVLDAARAAQAPLGAQATGNAQQTAETIPVHCRERQRMAGKPYPRSGCEVCGKWSPRAKECAAALTEQEAES